jgi:hypothetical protein
LQLKFEETNPLISQSATACGFLPKIPTAGVRVDSLAKVECTVSDTLSSENASGLRMTEFRTLPLQIISPIKRNSVVGEVAKLCFLSKLASKGLLLASQPHAVET